MEQQNKIIVTLMVKNEELTLAKTLDSIVQNTDIQCICIADTGSTDNTRNILIEWQIQNPDIKVIYIEEEWKDFSTNRNKILQYLEEYTSYNWCMFLDSNDEILRYDESLLDEDIDVFYTKLDLLSLDKDGKPVQSSLYSPRLFRLNKGFHFVSPVHEFLCNDEDTFRSGQTDRILLYQNRTIKKDMEKTMRRLATDVYMLNDYLKTCPECYKGRTYTHLGMTYRLLNNKPKAIKCYRESLNCDMKGREKARACYELAMLYGDEASDQFLWYLVKSLDYEVRHVALLDLSRYYFNCNNMQMSYVYSMACLSLKVPDSDTSERYDDVTNYQRYLHHAMICNRINSVEQGIHYIKIALRSCDENSQSQNEQDKIAECRKIFQDLLKNSKPVCE